MCTRTRDPRIAIENKNSKDAPMSLVERQDTMSQETAVWDGGMGSVSDYVALLKPEERK